VIFVPNGVTRLDQRTVPGTCFETGGVHELFSKVTAGLRRSSSGSPVCASWLAKPSAVQHEHRDGNQTVIVTTFCCFYLILIPLFIFIVSVTI
jgi:hypothetical protein